ncbi:flavin reductase family protein [Herbiconiux liukaitaii]|uniref:flavin reductase family protein n=1 Tax=Herbiconiux liukaitaii TaxID=3342799 RepID=UPI0035B9EF8E
MSTEHGPAARGGGAGPIDVDAFKRGMQTLAGHVTVLTTRDAEGNPVGITATAVCSLTAEPPSLLASINRSTWLGAVLQRSGAFGVNILSHEQVRVAQVFAGMDPDHKGSDKFLVGSWTDGINGSPLLEHSLASFDCTLDQLVERSTHLVAFGLITETRVPEHSADPLLYHRRLFGTMAAAG